jgi:murein DD-endopeptidase MepM/ murein hydrolase activator NlpD
VAGDTVRQGQVVGEIGFSGDTGFHVHLHQMLMSAPDFSAEGLPSYFDGVQRIEMGARAIATGPILNRARLDTGDLVQSTRITGTRP